MNQTTTRRLSRFTRVLCLLLLLLLALGALSSCGSSSSKVEDPRGFNEEEVTSDEITDLMETLQTEEENKTGILGLPLKSGLEGFWDILKVPIGWILDFCNRITFNYLLALLLFTLIMKLILIKSSINQQKNMVKQAAFAPKQRAISKKYAGRTDQATQQQMQQELMEAQKEAGVSAFGGCLPLLLQFPVLICLYDVVRSPLQYLSHISSLRVEQLQLRAAQLHLEGALELPEKIVTSIENLMQSGAGLRTAVSTGVDKVQLITIIRNNWDKFSDLFEGSSISAAADLPNFSVFGLDLSATPSLSTLSPLLIIPVLTFVAYFLSMKLSRKFSYQAPVQEGQVDAQKSMKIMDWVMPLMSLYISFQVPAILGVYWIYSSVLGILQQYILKKIYPYPVFTEEDYKEAERQYSGKSKKKKPSDIVVEKDPNRPKPRSLHHIDDDDEDTPSEVLKNKPVSSKYGDEDEPDETPKGNTAIGKAPLKDDSKPEEKKETEEKKKKGLFGKEKKK